MQKCEEKYDRFPNFHIVNDDFTTHDFGQQRFDIVYSAATIQWIPEEIAFSKSFALLKPGGILAMMLTKADYKTPNEELYGKIQKLYDQYYTSTGHSLYHGGFPDMKTRKTMAIQSSRSMTFTGDGRWPPMNTFPSAAPIVNHIVIPEPS